MQETDIRQKIAELRLRFGRLQATCGLRHINRQTLEEYNKEIKALEAQLN